MFFLFISDDVFRSKKDLKLLQMARMARVYSTHSNALQFSFVWSSASISLPLSTSEFRTHWQTVCIIFFCRFLLSRYYVVTYRRTTWFSQYVVGVGVGVCSYITVWTKRCACMWVCIDDDEASTGTVHRTVNSAPQPILARAPKGKYHKFNFKIEAAYRRQVARWLPGSRKPYGTRSFVCFRRRSIRRNMNLLTKKL